MKTADPIPKFYGEVKSLKVYGPIFHSFYPMLQQSNPSSSP